ncbi:imidazole glycerol phosphate synthase subunit HisF [Buchnera aphidicola (Formosaphis micheliae)]|uniref:imidazole glycerol phosphate synthase subunit HisF n=1 Tax=Buchnera aphidicola TaxID=9 RepID=UPI0031B85415
MLSKRIIPCLDVQDNSVVKGIQFRNHEIVGGIIELAKHYVKEGADELVFYDIKASSSNRLVDKRWIEKIASVIDIPFSVAGGIRSVKDASEILKFGADKISLNSFAIKDPSLITRIADHFGVQCVVVGVDSWYNKDTNNYQVCQYTGDENKTYKTELETIHWISVVQELGAGEIVLNMMNQDGMCNGYNLSLLKKVRKICNVPLVASGGAGTMEHFYHVFHDVDVEGALAASVFHKKIISISVLKSYLYKRGVEIRWC